VPTYDLTCEACGHAYEKFITRVIRDEDLVCPECGSDRVKKGVGGGFLNTRSSSDPMGACGTPLSECGSGGG